MDMKQLDQYIANLAPLVEMYSEFSVDETSMNRIIMPKKGVYRTLIEQSAQDLGLEKPKCSRIKAYMHDNQIMGAYVPTRKTMIAVPENLAECSEGIINYIIAHELVHRAQDVEYPDLFKRICEYDVAIEDKSIAKKEKKQLKKEKQALMTLVEGDATYLPMTEGFMGIADMKGKTGKSFNRVVSSILMVTVGLKETMQYMKGAFIIGSRYSERDEVKELYENLDKAIEVFSGSMFKVE